ncbi:hypothetical protein TWF788_005112 [Orbilia oligospora]|uniref:Uncharacterized protein n=1 Tax=Orbilia oligospora TaxID=2813651 RepID=A0A7C8P7G5_ORBOL|nr:hypothetical protein TWF788_005112 [Orbilia oligospora]
MRRTTNGYLGPEYGNKPTFRVQARWLLIRYIQSFGCLICIPFFVITANSRVSYARNSPKFIAIDGGWGYILAIACISLYILLSAASLFFICFNVVLSPIEGFGADVFILALWIASLAGTIVVRINYSKAISAAQSRQLATPSSPRVGLWMLFICLAVCIILSTYTTYLSYLQLAECRQKLRQRRSLDATVSLVPPSYSPPQTSTSNNTTTTTTSSPPQSPPQTAPRPVSVASSLWSRIRPTSSYSTSTTTTTRITGWRRQRDEERAAGGEEEPKPEETTGLTREQIIAERVEAVRAPPTYWYATSNRPRVDVGTTSVHDPEAGDETLPLYRP